MRARRLLLGLLLLLPLPAQGQKGKIVARQLDTKGEGYTVLKVWGSHYEMGQAQGQILAKEIAASVAEVKQYLGATLLVVAKTQMQAAVWKPAELEQELDGIVAGVKAVLPSTIIDKGDLKVLNTFGDWHYYACRSHSAWGSFVGSPTRTLSTRRLEFSMPSGLASTRHHVLLAREPSDGSVRWISLAFPGYVTAATAVNEHGTLVALHDYQSTMVLGVHMPRCVAARYAVTLVKNLPLAQHLDAVYTELSQQTIMTGTFINYYVPEGYGGVITCLPGQKCSKKRTPQSDYFGGKVLLTTNSETDGHSVPSGGEFMDAYYKLGGTKTIADHHGLMGHTGFHLLSVAYRQRGDMTIWFEGELSSGVTPTVKVEMSTLFSGATAPDAGVARDRGAPAAGDRPAATADSRPTDGPRPAGGDGCGVGLAPGSRAPGPGVGLLLLGLLLTGRRLRRRGQGRFCSR